MTTKETEPYIHLQNDEAEGAADCGCLLKRSYSFADGDPVFFLCPRHAAAPDLLTACQQLLKHCVTVGGFPEKGKGRTVDQQSAFDAARTAIAKAETPE